MSRSGLCPEHASDAYSALVSKSADYRRREAAAVLAGNATHAAHWRCFAEEHERAALRYSSLVLVQS